MDSEELVLALERVELFSSQGKCRRQHPFTDIIQLRTKGLQKQTIHVWRNCKICRPGPSSFRMPETVEQAILLLETTGKVNRSNIRRLLLGSNE